MKHLLVLDQHLDAHYHATFTKGADPQKWVGKMKRYKDELTGFRETAQARLEALEALSNDCGGDLTKRCAISANHLACLRAVLKEE